MKRTILSSLCLISAILVVIQSSAQEYPDMVGFWTGTVRVVSSGGGERLDVGGVTITEIDLELTIDVQDRETFLGRSRTSDTPRDNPGQHVWGSIRSTGEEALFITEVGAQGQIWFSSETSFEYCLTNLVDGTITSYCAQVNKQAD
ncbi:MAG: hypothetical protein GKR91_03590 [Pseudomonadales bacterium]|nr:hypothetical protein [Pseudomonadales bacterium]